MNNELKQKIMKEIETHAECFRPVSNIRWRMRCPICGDSQKNLTDTHCYIKCVYDSEEPIVYKCFLGNCNAQGVVGKYFLEKLGVKGDILNDVSYQVQNRISSLEELDIQIQQRSPNLDSPQVRYLEHRLGTGLSAEDYDRFKIIWDMNDIVPLITKPSIRNRLPSNFDRIQFLSDDKSMLLSRSFLENQKPSQWRKVPLFPSKNRSYYTIQSTFPLFTTERCTVHIAEGIFDILSVYKNFNTGENSIYLALLGSDYLSGIEYTRMKCLIGNNIDVYIYMDQGIDPEHLWNQLQPYKWLFHRIRVFQNGRGKDFGVPIEKIKVVEQKETRRKIV